MALIIAAGAAAALFRVPSRTIWHILPCLIAVLVFVPWIQFSLGLLPFAGQAWISSFYLFGFLLTLLFGARWEETSPLQLANALFLAIGFTSVISVWLQLFTWLNLSNGDVTDIWSMGLSGNRPYANLGQPNNLATLLIWGILGCFWAYLNGVFGAAVATFVAAFMLVGLALTQSRMGLLAITVLLVATWVWRRSWPSKRTPAIALMLYGYFWLVPFLLKWVNSALLLDGDASYLRLQQQGELRLSAWRLFLQAVADRPWFGYGWTEVGAAQLAVADKVPGLGSTFGHSHNLFLDLMLWVGVPLGLIVSWILIKWFWSAVRLIRKPEDAVLIMMLAVVGVHAMVELPLHYAYFLIPTGLVMGMMNVRLGLRVVRTTPRWTLAATWLATAIVLSVVIQDYFRVEASYNVFRFEKARIGLGKTPPGKPPEVLMLTQLREWNRAARFEVRPGMTPQQIAWIEDVTKTFPSAGGIYRLATALAMNERPQEAVVWLKKICKITDEAECALMQKAWIEESSSRDGKVPVLWPESENGKKK